MTRWIAILAVTSVAAPGFGQRIRSAGQIAGTAQFGPMVPGRSGVPMSVVVPVRLSISPSKAASGFVVSALSNFSFTPVASTAGGKSMGASDIGIGIVDVSWTQGTSGNATIEAGFGYDPATTDNSGRDGFGARSERATLADVLSPRQVIRVDKIPGKAASRAGELTVTVKLAARGQYLTPEHFPEPSL